MGHFIAHLFHICMIRKLANEPYVIIYSSLSSFVIIYSSWLSFLAVNDDIYNFETIWTLSLATFCSSTALKMHWGLF